MKNIKTNIQEYLNDFTNFIKKDKTKNDFVNFLVTKVKKNSNLLDDFKNKKRLKTFLVNQLFDKNINKLNNLPEVSYPKDKIISALKDGLKNSSKLLPFNNAFNILVLPAANSFIKQKMNGVSGYTPDSKTIILMLDHQITKNNGFFQEIRATLSHEYNHSVRFFYFPPQKFNSLADAIVNEGLAESFRVAVFNIPPTAWAKALSYKESKALYQKIKSQLDSKSYKLYQDIFFGSNKYPLWSGYSIGFHLIGDFLKRKTSIKWCELIKKSSADILKEINWRA